MSLRITPLIISLLFMLVKGSLGQSLMIQDGFGRDLLQDTLRMVDWEGEIANPAIRIVLIADASAAFPISVELKADHPRLYFDMPSQTGMNGPAKTLQITSVDPVEIYLSIFSGSR